MNFRIKLIKCDIVCIEKILEGDEELRHYLGVYTADNWCTFGSQIFSFVRDRLKEGIASSEWWTYLPLLIQYDTIIGTCGFKGPPTKVGSVEIGYEVAEAYQNKGYATEMTLLLIKKAFEEPTVNFIIAHTLANENASTSVLRKCSFIQISQFVDKEEGLVWKWKLKRTSRLPKV